MPDPFLSALDVLTHGVLLTPREAGALKTGTLRAQDVLRAHTACNWQHGGWNPSVGLGPSMLPGLALPLKGSGAVGWELPPRL